MQRHGASKGSKGALPKRSGRNCVVHCPGLNCIVRVEQYRRNVIFELVSCIVHDSWHWLVGTESCMEDFVYTLEIEWRTVVQQPCDNVKTDMTWLVFFQLVSRIFGRIFFLVVFPFGHCR